MTVVLRLAKARRVHALMRPALRQPRAQQFVFASEQFRERVERLTVRAPAFVRHDQLIPHAIGG
jgi:hypothetical protein